MLLQQLLTKGSGSTCHLPLLLVTSLEKGRQEPKCFGRSPQGAIKYPTGASLGLIGGVVGGADQLQNQAMPWHMVHKQAFSFRLPPSTHCLSPQHYITAGIGWLRFPSGSAVRQRRLLDSNSCLGQCSSVLVDLVHAAGCASCCWTTSGIC